MTFFHFLNCAAVTSAPFVITYKCSVLSEYSCFWRCVQTGAFYLVTQLVKLLILATFFPVYTGDPNSTAIGGMLNVARASVDLLDLVGLYLAIEQLSGGKGHIRFMIAGVGWASAEVAITRFLHLWFGARGMEFDWKYIQLCLDSNLVLLQHIATASFLWMWARQNQLGSRLSSMVSMLLLATCYKPLLLDYTRQILSLGDWSLLVINGAMTTGIAFACLSTYVTITCRPPTANGLYHK